MGRIFDMAKEQWGNNFIFVFTNDHGGQWPLGKWNLYDSGTRIPLMAVWPGKIKAGSRTDAMVSWVDILPTLLDLSGEKVPADIDGQSFGPVLLGERNVHRDRIFTTHTGDGVMNVFPIRSVRIGKYKYIWNLRPDAWHTNHSDRDRLDGAGAYWDSWDVAAKTDPKAAAILKNYYTRPAEEFFDLERDPLEYNNLASLPEHSGQVKEFREIVEQWAKDQGDDLQPHREPYPTSKPLPELRRPETGK